MAQEMSLSASTEPPRVLYIDHDDEFRAIAAADSFAEFLDLLYEDAEVKEAMRQIEERYGSNSADAATGVATGAVEPNEANE